MKHSKPPFRKSALALAAIGFLGLAFAGEPAFAADRGAVYVLGNQTTANTVLVYARSEDGQLRYSGEYPTGGTGANTGVDPLASQGSIVRKDGFVFAVNAGSNDLTVFRALGTGLEAVGRFPSGGTTPTSVDVRGNLVYVLNSGGTPNITGFTIDSSTGSLTQIPDSRRALAGGTGSRAAEVHFSSDGESLIVTEKGTQTIDVFTLDAQGVAKGQQSFFSSGAVPFGFGVTRRGYVVVTEAGGGSVSSYDLTDNGGLRQVTGSLALGQHAVCWLQTSADGHFAYTANAASNTISSIEIEADGSLKLLDAVAATPTTPLDMALAREGGYLYVRDGSGGLTGYRIASDGSLSLVTSVSGVPASAQGIAAF